MRKCWEENPDDRPTFAKLKNTMKDMEMNHRVNSVINTYFVTRILFYVQYFTFDKVLS